MPRYLTDNEIRLQLDALFRDKVAMHRLRSYARWQAAKTKYGYHCYHDLIGEAFRRALQKQWEEGEPAEFYIKGAIRSVAWDWMEPWDQLYHPDFEKAGAEITSENFEEQFLQREEFLEIISLFNDDPVAQTMVKLIALGIDGEELRKRISLSSTDYHSKRKLIRRRINSYLRVQK